jgi:biopolymer transport protein TolR
MEAGGKIFVDKDEVTEAILPDVLQQIVSKASTGATAGPDGPKPPQVFLRADKSLDYGRVMRVMGELNHAGLNRVALVTVGDDGK